MYSEAHLLVATTFEMF